MSGGRLTLVSAPATRSVRLTHTHTHTHLNTHITQQNTIFSYFEHFRKKNTKERVRKMGYFQNRASPVRLHQQACGFRDKKKFLKKRDFFTEKMTFPYFLKSCLR